MPISDDTELWLLIMANMRRSKYEYSFQPVAYAPSHEALVEFIQREKADVPYTDHELDFEGSGQAKSWHKAFRRGSPLEWYNLGDFKIVPIHSLNEGCRLAAGSYADERRNTLRELLLVGQEHP